MKQAQQAARCGVSKIKRLTMQVKRVFWWLDSLLLSLLVLAFLLILVAFAGGVLRFAPWPVVRDLTRTRQAWLLLLLPLLVCLCYATARVCLARSSQPHARRAACR